MRGTTFTLAPAALVVLLAFVAAGLTAVAVLAQTATVTLVGAGDVASCHSDRDSATAELLGNIPGTIFTLGDNVYPDGTAAQFANCYDPTWGEYKRRTKPTAGNHDYRAAGGKPYFDYFGARGGASGRGYYSYNRGSWHIVALNSNCAEVGGCGEGSTQLEWLRNDLAANPAGCTLAYFHHARFSSGSGHGNDPTTAPFWKVLYTHNADVVLSGHDHDYERFAPQKPDGTRSPEQGIRQFVVGTGGAELRPFGTIEPNSQSRNASAFRVLKLTLHPKSYEWRFVPVAGKTFSDSGSDRCH